jgi:hypothetical protein
VKKYALKIMLLLPLFLPLAACQKAVKECPVCVPKTYIVNEGIPEPTQVEEPTYPTDQLTAESTDEEVAKAYVSSEKLARTYAEQLEVALQPFIDAYLRTQAAKNANRDNNQ